MFGDKDLEQQYRPLARDEHDSDDADEVKPLPPLPKQPERRRRWLPSGRWRYACYAGLWIVSNLIASQAGALLAVASVDIDRECAAHTTQYSPLLKDVHIKYDYQMFNGSFMQENIYRRVGSPEVDAAWEALGVDYRAGVIAAEEGPASGLTSRHVQRSDEFGGGYFVNVEGMHHLHCLNLVRKALYYNYQYYKDLGLHAFKNEEPILRLHVSHCLDTVRQVLMCNADTAVLGQVWWDPKNPKAFPDFQTRHKCKNYEAIRQWAEALQAPPADTLPKGYLKQPGPGEVYEFTP